MLEGEKPFMALFHLDWHRCLDGYRIEEQLVSTWDLKGYELWRGIVSNSENWEQYQLFDIPAAYRQFANWDRSEGGLMKLINAYGFLVRAKKRTAEASYTESLGRTAQLILQVKNLVEAIDSRDWQSIAQQLDQAGRDGTGNVGRLGVIFEVSADQPVLKLRPANLADALQVQALADASLGIEHRKCKNPECDQYFPVKGHNAYRSDAEYHSEPCRRRHAYLIKKDHISRKKERRS